MSDHHYAVVQNQDGILGLRTDLPTVNTRIPDMDQTTIDANAVLFPHMPNVLLAFHLVYEVRLSNA